MKSILTILLLSFAFIGKAQTPFYDENASNANRIICAPYFELVSYGEFVFRDLSPETMIYKKTLCSNYNVQDTSVSFFDVYVVSSITGELKLNIAGTPSAYGDFTLTIVLTTPGGDSVGIVLPSFSIRENPTITTDPNPIVCSGDGIVNLEDFIDPDGGTFMVDSDPISKYIRADTMSLTYYDYEYNDGYCTSYGSVFLNLYASPTVTMTTTQTVCGAATGSATASIVNPSIVNSQTWTNGVVNQTSVNNLAAGQYSFYVEDTNTCVTTTNFTITAAGTSLNETVTNVLCFGGNNGSISVAPTGLTAPVTYLWSSGQSASTISNLVAGTYTVYVKDASGCEISKVITVSQPAQINAMLSTDVSPTCGASDGVVSVVNISGGSGAINALWSNGSTSTTITNISAGVYSVTLTDNNGCQLNKSMGLSENGAPTVANKTVLAEDCGQTNGGIILNFYWSDTISSISWSNGATTKDITNVAAGNYVCTAINNHNCKSVFNWNVPKKKPKQQDICMVTVDSTTTTNLVVWEKVETIGIDYYNIYRETNTVGEYLLIDTVKAANISIFNDVVASPSERSWSYRVAAVNLCGEEGAPSFPHRTIHMNLVDGGSFVTLSWNAYQGTPLSMYDIWRHTDATGWQLAGSVPYTNLVYQDMISISEPGLDYLIEFVPLNPCHAEKAQDFNTTRSNRQNSNYQAGFGTGNSNNGLTEDYLNGITLFPNPTHEVVFIKQNDNNALKFNLTAINGQHIQSFESNAIETKVDLQSYKSGVYLLEITFNDTKLIKRIVKQ